MNQDASSAAGKKIKDSQEESQDIESADKTQRMLDAVTSKMQPLQTLQDDSFQGHLAKTAEDVEEVGVCQGFEIFGNTSLGDKYYPETGGLFRLRSPQARHVGTMLVDAGPALNQHCPNVLCYRTIFLLSACMLFACYLHEHVIFSLTSNHLHPLQAANCCRNSRLIVDEDDIKWVKN